MPVFMYASSAASIASGTLTGAFFLLSLTTRPASFRRMRRIFHVGRVTKRGARRAFLWRSFGSSLGVVVNGTLVVLGVDDATVARLCVFTGAALVIFQFGSLFALRARRSPAG
jgi:hypothetical protein